MPFIKVYIHFVWSTKNRIPFLATREIRETVWNHIRKNAIEKDIHIDFINGHAEHCHCLVSLGVDQTIQKVMQLIKGESSFWINKENILLKSPSAPELPPAFAELPPALAGGKFQWQEEYFAVSVSESMVHKVRNYIKNQEQHHSKKSFNEEYEEFITKYGFQKFKDEG